MLSRGAEWLVVDCEFYVNKIVTKHSLSFAYEHFWVRNLERESGKMKIIATLC